MNNVMVVCFDVLLSSYNGLATFSNLSMSKPICKPEMCIT